jgi:hypothetical protein
VVAQWGEEEGAVMDPGYFLWVGSKCRNSQTVSNSMLQFYVAHRKFGVVPGL